MIFVDTSAWVALEDKRDANYTAAIKYKNDLAAARTRLLTSSYILDEAYTVMLLNIGYQATVNFKRNLDLLTNSGVVAVLHITPEIEEEAWAVFERFNRDKWWSYTDCTSKVVMDRLGFYEAFTFDKHFEQMGFVRRP